LLHGLVGTRLSLVVSLLVELLQVSVGD
jgi:hypothetical protein